MKIGPTADDGPLSLRSAKLAVVMERRVFPWFFLFLAWRRLSAALDDFPDMRELLHGGNAQHVLLFIQNVLLFILIGLYGVMLLLSRPAAVLPSKRKHILIPLTMTCYFMFYGMLSYLPASLRRNLLPPGWQFPSAMAAVILSLIGYSIAIWALIYLRRSFAIFVSVKEVVSEGPYAYVRHPMYLGYLLDTCGITLADFSPAILILGCAFIALLVERARMEEEKLCEASEPYRRYGNRTGFLFPRLRIDESPTVSRP